MYCTEEISATATAERTIVLADSPNLPSRKMLRQESSQDILAPTNSLAPGATPRGWTQARGLAHDFW